MSQNLLQGLQAGYPQTTLFEYYTMQIENRCRLVGNFFASATFFRPFKNPLRLKTVAEKLPVQFIKTGEL
jgi:hypothetical protein